MTRRADLARLRAAWWAWRTLRRARRALRGGQVKRIELLPPPSLPESAATGVEAILRRQRSSCLESALVRQRWLAAHGRRVPVAIGVTAPSRGFLAHAWLVGEDEAAAAAFHELTRLEP